MLLYEYLVAGLKGGFSEHYGRLKDNDHFITTYKPSALTKHHDF
jgi:hypothetical protein